MNNLRAILFAAALLLPGAALASERGMTIRAGDLYAEPYVDAAKLSPLAANQPITIVARKGGWLAIDVGGKRGWVRMLIVRLESAAAAPSTAALRTGSTGRTIATGIKGLDEGSIRDAAIDQAQLARLEALGASESEARALAAQGGLQENQVAALKPGKLK